jgi:hypothetical protein
MGGKSEPTVAMRVPRSFARKVRRLALDAKLRTAEWVARELEPGLDLRFVKLLVVRPASEAESPEVVKIAAVNAPKQNEPPKVVRIAVVSTPQQSEPIVGSISVRSAV